MMIYSGKSSLIKILYAQGVLLLAWVLVSCSSSASGGTANAAGAVENYLDALVSKDAPRLVNYACAAWEADANLELDSLAAVEVRLEDMACAVSGQAGDLSLVSCTGSLVANYEGEDQEIDLADRVYEVINEGGEWRVCGYR